MTDNERALHAVLTLCIKPFRECHRWRDIAEALENRLEEIRIITENRVVKNAKQNRIT